MIYTAALFSEEACEEWIGYYGWPICGVWHWPQRETHVGMLTQHEVFLQAGVQASENTNQDLAGGRD
jgi:hypothetical protein